jgi:hypothetical protein
MPFPNNYLPSNAQPWGREVQKRIETTEATVARNERNNDARDTQLASAQFRLNDQLIKTNALAVQANQTASQAAATAQQASAAIDLANEAITQIQFILGILDEVTPPGGSNSATGVFQGPSYEFDNETIVSVTVTSPSGPTAANISASLTLLTETGVSGFPMSGDFYITDGTTANSPTAFNVSGTAGERNTYSQGYTKSYSGVSTVTLYVKIDSIQALVDESQKISATLNVSASWG